MKNVYKFRVGVRNLGGSGSSGSGESTGSSSGSSGYNHACFLINTDLFEYGTGKDKIYLRRKNVGRDPNFDWDELGKALNGTTYVSPDDLEKKIKDSNLWNGNIKNKNVKIEKQPDYSMLNHNCHDFVQFCLREVGCHETMIQKKGLVYKKQ